ncbi:MAG: DNA-3-methyladenine glycosylase [Myxococcales bacterium]|nr:DNA-3-methyladenine glycosylase [Myxococcales bacterium]
MSGGLLPQRFFDDDARVVAPALLGQELWRGEVGLRITETEAYWWPDDSASHCRRGETPRNAPMWGPPGYAYVYLCYGIHHLLNIVTGPAGQGAAVLIRSCEPIAGLEVIRERRRGLDGPVLLTGPGKVGAALDLDTGWSGHALFEAGGLELRRGAPPPAMRVGTRVGVRYADERDRLALARFAAAGTRWVSEARELRPDR